jgi:hypothetical protein
MTPFIRESIIRDYKRGDKVIVISTKYKVSPAFVNKVARAAELPCRISETHRAAHSLAKRQVIR